MNIVFATDSLVVSHPTTGLTVSVSHGAHWPADDPVVKAYPQFFTDDPRYGLTSSRPFGEDGYPVDTTAAKKKAAPADETPRKKARTRRTRKSAAVEQATAEPGQKRQRAEKAPALPDTPQAEEGEKQADEKPATEATSAKDGLHL